MELFVLKDSHGFFYFLHEDKKDLSAHMTTLESCEKYNADEIIFIKEKFSKMIQRDKIKVHKLKYSI